MSKLNSFYEPNRLDVSLDCGTELVTKQSFKDETDINNILSQYKRTGVIDHINAQEPVYADLPDVSDYQTSLHQLQDASDAFDALPAVVRRYFQNDPARLLEALGDPAQKDKLVEYGILKGPDQAQPPGNPVNVGDVTIPVAGEPTLP